MSNIFFSMKYYIDIVTVVIYSHKFDVEHSVDNYDNSVMHMPWYLSIFVYLRENCSEENVASKWN